MKVFYVADEVSRNIEIRLASNQIEAGNLKWARESEICMKNNNGFLQKKVKVVPCLVP